MRAKAKGSHTKIQPKRFEFSKLIVILIFLACVQITAYGEWMMYLSYKVALASEMKSIDMTPLVYIIPGWIGLAASVISFYLTKSKAENQIKLGAIYSGNASEIIEPTNNV